MASTEDVTLKRIAVATKVEPTKSAKAQVAGVGPRDN